MIFFEFGTLGILEKYHCTSNILSAILSATDYKQ